MINPVDIKYFIETAKSQHISRAAERLGITQPALSHCLKRMENALGHELFIRSKKGVSLTPTGQKFFEQAEGLLEQWEKVMSSVHDQAESVGGTIRIGVHPAVAQYTLPLFLPDLLKDHPKLKVQLTHGLSRHMTEAVISSKLDVAIAVNPVNHPDLIIKELCKDTVSVWKTKTCKNDKLLLIEPSLLQTQDLLKKLSKRGWHFDQTLESSSLEVICQLMKAGTGAAILPKRVVDAFEIHDLVTDKNAPVFQDRICLVFKPEFRKTKTGQAFIEYVAESIDQ